MLEGPISQSASGGNKLYILKVSFPLLCYFHTSETSDMSHRMMNIAQPIRGNIYFLYLFFEFLKSISCYVLFSGRGSGWQATRICSEQTSGFCPLQT